MKNCSLPAITVYSCARFHTVFPPSVTYGTVNVSMFPYSNVRERMFPAGEHFHFSLKINNYIPRYIWKANGNKDYPPLVALHVVQVPKLPCETRLSPQQRWILWLELIVMATIEADCHTDNNSNIFAPLTVLKKSGWNTRKVWCLDFNFQQFEIKQILRWVSLNVERLRIHQKY